MTGRGFLTKTSIIHHLLSFAVLLKNTYAKIKRQFKRPPFPISEDESIKLHLGCGLINNPKFINIDSLPFPHIHYIRSISDLSPFQDCSVDFIYACHCLEHFSHREVERVLAEWLRVLKPNGILRLSVPDFDSVIEIYYANNRSINDIQSVLMGSQDHQYNFHKVLFNKDSLTRYLRNVGFRKIQTWDSQKEISEEFKDFSQIQYKMGDELYPVSLNLEAIK